VRLAIQPLSSEVKLRSPISFKANFDGIDDRLAGPRA